MGVFDPELDLDLTKVSCENLMDNYNISERQILDTAAEVFEVDVVFIIYRPPEVEATDRNYHRGRYNSDHEPNSVVAKYVSTEGIHYQIREEQLQEIQMGSKAQEIKESIK